jgi:nucleotide sugar dehydrogenase
MKTLCIVGVGYVGLPNALLFAEKGYRVIAADINPRIVELTNKGISHINDPILKKEVPKIWRTGRLKATTNIIEAVSRSDAVIISVPTPAERGLPDLTAVKNSCSDIAKGLKKGSLVVLESTVYPGVCRNIIRPILEKGSGLVCGKGFYLAHCPERMNPGDSSHTIKNTPRIVGGIDSKSADMAYKLYKSVIDAEIFRVSSLEAAEMVKLVENTQRDINIAYMNEIAIICEKLGLDVKEIINACATKWNFYKVWPGPGVGGHCIPNNPWYIIKKAVEIGYNPKLIRTARAVNEEMPDHVVELIRDGLKAIGKDIRSSKIAILGVAYKADVDDVRQAPSRAIVSKLKRMGADVWIHDPKVGQNNMLKVHNKIMKNLSELKSCDCIVFVTDHSEYKKIKINGIKRLVGKKAVLVDTRFIFNPKDVKKAGFVYKGVGRT